MSTLERAASPGDGSGTPSGARRFVTTMAPMEQHVGAQVLGALRTPDLVAVLTVVTVDAEGRQRLVSIGLDRSALADVQAVVDRGGADRTRSVPCAGFPVHLEGPDSPPEPAS